MTVVKRQQYRSSMLKRRHDQASTAQFPPALDLAVFRQMADMSNDAFYLCDERGRFLYVNERATSINGYSRDELLTMSVSDINPDFPPDRLAEFVAGLGQGAMAPFAAP